MGIASLAMLIFLVELFSILMLQTRGESGGVAEKKRMF